MSYYRIVLVFLPETSLSLLFFIIYEKMAERSIVPELCFKFIFLGRIHSGNPASGHECKNGRETFGKMSLQVLARSNRVE